MGSPFDHANPLIYKNGNFSPLLARSLTDVPSLSLDFTRPLVQQFPTTVDGIQSILGNDSATPMAIFPLQETSGNFLDVIGSGSLALTSGLQGQKVTGIWDGVSMTTRNAWESTNTNSKALATSSSFFDNPTNSFAFIVTVRVKTSSNVSLFGKRDATAGFCLRAASTGFRLDLKDTLAVSVNVIESGDNTDTSELHTVMCVVNRTTDQAELYTKSGKTTADISTLGSLTCAQGFALGLQQGFLSSCPNAQITYLALFQNAAAEALGQTEYDNFVRHGKDPTGKLTTQTRNCVVSLPVSSTQVAHYGIDQIPIGYDVNLLNTRKLGLYAPAARTQLCLYSEDFTNAAWVKTNVSVVSNDVSAPDGFKVADKLTASSANATVHQVFTTTINTDYTGKVWILESTAGATGRVILYDETNTAEIASTPFTATSSWQEVEVQGTTNGTAVSCSLKIEIDTSGHAIFATQAVIVAGLGCKFYTKSEGSTVSTVVNDFQVIDTIPIRLGRVDTQAALVSDLSASQIIWSTESTTDWRVVWHAAGLSTRFYYYNSAGASWASMIGGAAALNTSKLYVARWDIDDSGKFPEDSNRSASGHLDGVVQGTPQTTSSTLLEEWRNLRIGVNFNGTQGFDGFIETIKVYNKVGKEPT